MPQTAPEQPMSVQELSDAVRYLLCQQTKDREWGRGVDALLEANRTTVDYARGKIRDGFAKFNQNFAHAQDILDGLEQNKVDGVQAAVRAAQIDQSLEQLNSAATAARLELTAYQEQMEHRLKAAEAKLETYAADLQAKLAAFEQGAESAVRAVGEAAQQTPRASTAPASTVLGLAAKVDEVKAQVQDLEAKAAQGYAAQALALDQQKMLIDCQSAKLLAHDEAAQGYAAQAIALDQVSAKVLAHDEALTVHQDEIGHMSAVVDQLAAQARAAPVRAPPGESQRHAAARADDDPARAPPGVPQDHGRQERDRPQSSQVPYYPMTPGARGQADQGDAWGQYLRQRRHGADDEPPAGGPVPRPPASWAGRLSRWRSPFDRKEAKEITGYDGKEGCEVWHRKTTYYLMSKVPDIKCILDWAEQQKDPIRNDALDESHELQRLRATGRLESDPAIVSFHLWGFLNLNLKGYAWEVFEGCPAEDGLEVWRRLLVDQAQRTPAELLQLEKGALNPPVCTNLNALPQAVVRWEAAVKLYHEALPLGSPERLSDNRQTNALMRMLPYVIQEKAIYDGQKFANPHELKKWVFLRLRDASTWKALGQESRAMLLESPPDTDESLDAAVLALGPDASDEELLALMKRRPRADRPARKRTPTQPDRPVICYNCGDKDHSGPDCPKPKVDVKDRKCFTCGEAGHRAFHCPKKKGLAAKSLVTAAPTAAPASYAMTLVGQGDEEPMHRRAQRRTAMSAKPWGPAAAPAGRDFAHPNPFRALATADTDEWPAPQESQRKAVTLADYIRKDEPTRRSRCRKPGKVASGDPLASLPTTGRPGYHRATSADAGSGVRGEYFLDKNRPADITEEEKIKGVLEAEYEHQWEILKSAIPGYLGPEERRRRAEYDLAVKEYYDQAKVIPVEAPQRTARIKDSQELKADKGDVNVNFLEMAYAEEALNVGGNDEPEFMDFEGALDSGCASHVCDRVDIPGYEVKESEGSRRGANFVAAGGKVIPNEGESALALVTKETGNEIASDFQIAAVTRPLWSLSQILDKLPEGHDARFTRQQAQIRTPAGTPIAYFERKGGLYVSTMKLRNPKHQGFRRQH